jgi:hypothetical protein
MPESRGAPRHLDRTGRLLRVHSPDGQMLTYALLEDVSAAGLRLLTARRCPAGLAVLAPLPPHPLAGRTFPFLVARTSADGAAPGYVAGPFVPPITDEEARALAGVTS